MRRLANFREAFSLINGSDDVPNASALIDLARSNIELLVTNPTLDPAIVDDLRMLFTTVAPAAASKGYGALERENDQLQFKPLSAGATDGVSLVTCCRNRNENLLRALPSWLALDDLDEIVVVDWTSERPVFDDIAAAGLADPRIRVVRVPNADRWILTRAFNVGFRAASHTRILKVDADIVLHPEFLRRNSLGAGTFIAGNWRIAQPGQEYINGFFYLEKAAIAAVGGFNEYIVSYGWDDDDIYSRLILAGYQRVDVDAETLTHLDHADEQRFDGANAVAMSAREEFHTSTRFKIRANRIVAGIMPSWDARSPMSIYKVSETDRPGLVTAEYVYSPAAPPDSVLEISALRAEAEMLSWTLGPRAMRLDGARLDALMARPLDSISRLEVAIALGPDYPRLASRGCHVCINITSAEIFENPEFAQALSLLSYLAEGRVCFLLNIAPADADPYRPFMARYGVTAFKWDVDTNIPDCDGNVVDEAHALPHNVLVTPRRLIQDFRTVMTASDAAEPASASEPQDLPVEPDEPHIDRGLKLESPPTVLTIAPELTAKSAETHAASPDTTNDPSPPSSAPPAILRRGGKVVIDAQHGLGNRLRAIGSAAAIARALERDLIIVWQRDLHCDAPFERLFDYAGEIWDTPFIETAQDQGWKVFDYMSADALAGKDAPIPDTLNEDLYLRSAFTLRHAASDWTSENQFIKRLTPSGEVQALLHELPLGFDLTMHIRMAAGAGTPVEAWDSQENWSQDDHAKIVEWRSKSRYEAFIDHVRKTMPHLKPHQMFVAADMVETYALVEEALGGEVHKIRRSLDDRSGDQLVTALADIYALGRTGRMLASSWSSFSEAALRMAPLRPKCEYSGKDF